MRNILNKLRKLIPFKYLALMGPGLIGAVSGNDAGGIATYSTLGAGYGYKLLWLMLLLLPTLSVVQVISIRLGVVTGKGLTALIRERFPLRKAMFGIVSLFLSNSLTAVSEFLGIAAVFELFHIPKIIGVPVAGFVVWWSIVKGTYRRVEKLFILFSAFFLSYIAASFFTHPDWGKVAYHLVVPSFQFDPAYLSIFIATIATSITPYMQIYTQSSAVEKGLTPKDLTVSQIDAVLGSVFAVIVAIFIIITTGATLFPRGILVNSASDAALALKPLAGNYAFLLFGLGLFGASMLSAAVLPLTTAFSTCEAFGWRAGINYTFRQAPVFYSIFTTLILLGVAITLIPGINLIKLLVLTYLINGIFIPIELFYMIRLANDRELMEKYVNPPLLNFFAILIFAVTSFSILFLLITFF